MVMAIDFLLEIFQFQCPSLTTETVTGNSGDHTSGDVTAVTLLSSVVLGVQVFVSHK